MASAVRASRVLVIGTKSTRTAQVIDALAPCVVVTTATAQRESMRRAAEPGTTCVVIADDVDGVSALELLAAIHRARKQMPVYLITDPGDMADAVAGMQLGAAAVIEIPPSFDLLRSCVSRAAAQVS
jgi:DNA-binding NtrC family response regulator